MKQYAVFFKNERVYDFDAVDIKDAIKVFATTFFITGSFEILTISLAKFAGYIIVEL